MRSFYQKKMLLKYFEIVISRKAYIENNTIYILQSNIDFEQILIGYFLSNILSLNEFMLN